MTIEPRTLTPEEEAYFRLLDEAGEELSWPARALFSLADYLAYGSWMVHNSVFAMEEYEEAEVKMGFVASGLTDRDQELLARIVRAARRAADSFDPDDHETIAGYRVHPADIHGWHKMTAGRIEDTLEEENARRRDNDRG